MCKRNTNTFLSACSLHIRELEVCSLTLHHGADVL